MDPRSLLLADPPKLSDESASEILDFLHAFATAFENHYGNQLRRHYQPIEPPQPDLFDDFGDDLPPF